MAVRAFLEDVDFLSTSQAAERPPHWRYLQARADAASGRFRLPRRADFQLRAVTAYLARFDRAGAQPHRFVDYHPYPLFKRALDLFRDRERACHLESLALARLDPKVIAKRLAIDVHDVNFYEDLFFDVREHLPSTDYIVRFGIQAESRVGAPETMRRRVAMKALAYFCGPKALDDFFLLGQQDEIKYWCHPMEITRQLAASRVAEQIGDFLLSSPRLPADPKAYAEWVDALVALLEKMLPGQHPCHLLAWKVQQGEKARATL